MSYQPSAVKNSGLSQRQPKTWSAGGDGHSYIVVEWNVKIDKGINESKMSKFDMVERNHGFRVVISTLGEPKHYSEQPTLHQISQVLLKSSYKLQSQT